VVKQTPPERSAKSVRRRRWANLIGVVFIGIVAALAVPSPAQAVTTRLTIGPGLGSCPAGYVCLWTLNNFTGTGYAFYNSETDYSTLPAPFNGIQDNSWSFYSHGNTYDIKFYRDNYWGGDSFVLCRGEAIAYLPSNSTMPQSGAEPGRGWRDAVTSHHFGAWC
jgi:hypothetical protein